MVTVTMCTCSYIDPQKVILTKVLAIITQIGNFVQFGYNRHNKSNHLSGVCDHIITKLKMTPKVVVVTERRLQRLD